MVRFFLFILVLLNFGGGECGVGAKNMRLELVTEVPGRRIGCWGPGMISAEDQPLAGLLQTRLWGKGRRVIRRQQDWETLNLRLGKGGEESNIEKSLTIAEAMKQEGIYRICPPRGGTPSTSSSSDPGFIAFTTSYCQTPGTSWKDFFKTYQEWHVAPFFLATAEKDKLRSFKGAVESGFEIYLKVDCSSPNVLKQCWPEIQAAISTENTLRTQSLGRSWWGGLRESTNSVVGLYMVNPQDSNFLKGNGWIEYKEGVGTSFFYYPFSTPGGQASSTSGHSPRASPPAPPTGAPEKPPRSPAP